MKRATLLIVVIRRLYDYFNPRPREEGDVVYTYSKGVVPSISIHALVKRATYINIIFIQNIRHFNPRPREEGDIIL